VGEDGRGELGEGKGMLGLKGCRPGVRELGRWDVITGLRVALEEMVGARVQSRFCGHLYVASDAGILFRTGVQVASTFGV
jgi:hypothetical protein